MRTEAIVLLHPTARGATGPGIARRAAGFGGALVVALAIAAGGAALVLLVLALVVVAAPIVAGLTAWLVWRAHGRWHRTPLSARLRIHRRARALGLVVVGATPEPTALRAASG